MSLGGELKPKVVVDDRFELVERLDDRGAGEVWKARDPNFKTKLALLKFLRRTETDGEMPEGLDAVVRRLRALKHPNLLQTTGSGLWGARPYLVQSWFEGVSLTAAMDAAHAKGRVVPLAALEKLVDQVCAALEALHAAGEVHGELHPGCVLVQATAGGQFDSRVIDVGVGAFAEGGTAFIYADCVAPERREGRPLRATADVYSLAMVMRRALREASEAKSWVAPFAEDYHGREDVPAAVWEVMERATRASAAERYQSVTEMRETLRGAWKSAARLEARGVKVEGAKMEAAQEKEALPMLHEMVERAAEAPVERRAGVRGDEAGAALLEGLLGKLPAVQAPPAVKATTGEAKGTNPWATEARLKDSTLPVEFLAVYGEKRGNGSEERTMHREQMTEVRSPREDEDYGATVVQVRDEENLWITEVPPESALGSVVRGAGDIRTNEKHRDVQRMGIETQTKQWRKKALTILILLSVAAVILDFIFAR